MTATAQPPRGFWAAAQAEPDRIAVVDPAGREWTAGEIALDANRLVHALRERGLTEGDPVAMLLPNRAEVFVVLMALFQAGWNFVPLNSNLTAGRGLLHLARRRRQGPRGRRRGSPTSRRRRPRSPACPQSGRIAVGGADPGRLHPARRRPGRAARRRRRRTGSPASSCSTRRARPGRPKAVERALPSFDPEVWVQVFSGNLMPLRHRTGRGRRAPRDVADVPHGPVVLRLLLGALRAHRRPHGEVGRRGGAPAH